MQGVAAAPFGGRPDGRIRDPADRRLYIPGSAKRYPTLTPLIGGTVNLEHVQAHWDEVLGLASSIRQGTVTASLMLRELGGYARQNGSVIALRELGRIERTLFTLEWLQNTELRRWVDVGLNKGKARNALSAHGHALEETLLQHLSPLGWDYISLTGDYTWKAHRSVERGQFRALRPLSFS